MATITNLITPVYENLNAAFFSNAAPGLIRLGYFDLTYNGEGNMTVGIYDTNTITRAIATMQGVSTLRSDQFHAAGQQQQNPFFVLVRALVYKAFLELFIQSNLRPNVKFNCIISLDIYANRNAGQALLFHKDATERFPTKFFTLTYVIPDPNIIVKGPTIVTDENLPNRFAVIPAVRHGTTVGIDNTAVLHATPDTTVRIAMPGSYANTSTTNNNTRAPNDNLFSLQHQRNVADYQGTELAPGYDDRRTQAITIANATRDTQRSFIRTWYNIEGFPDDPGATFTPVQLELNYQVVIDLVQEIQRNTCFIETGVIISPDIHLGSQEMQRISLGGRAETVDNYAQRTPLLEYKPLIGKEPQNAYEQKSKPSIGDVLASPVFQKLAASTDNFVLGAVVKGKGHVLPMGGKQASWSKKGKKRAMRTSKRGKRSRTTRRMGWRKRKTYRKSKHTKKR